MMCRISIPNPGKERDDFVGMYLNMNGHVVMITANEGVSIHFRELTIMERIKYKWQRFKGWFYKNREEM